MMWKYRLISSRTVTALPPRRMKRNLTYIQLPESFYPDGYGGGGSLAADDGLRARALVLERLRPLVPNTRLADWISNCCSAINRLIRLHAYSAIIVANATKPMRAETAAVKMMTSSMAAAAPEQIG